MTRYYGPSKDQIERAKKERKAARRRPVKDGRLGPVKYGVAYGGDTGAITTEKEMTNGGN